MQILPGADENEAIVYDSYRFEIVNLTLATEANTKAGHVSRSRSPLPNMPALQKLLQLRDSIIHVTFANDVLTCFTTQQKVLSYDFQTHVLQERDLPISVEQQPLGMNQMPTMLKNKLAKGLLKQASVQQRFGNAKIFTCGQDTITYDTSAV